jgi:hypothetical protein
MVPPRSPVPASRGRRHVEHGADLVKTRMQTVDRLCLSVTRLAAAGAPRGLTADRAADILR